MSCWLPCTSAGPACARSPRWGGASRRCTDAVGPAYTWVGCLYQAPLQPLELDWALQPHETEWDRS